MSKRVSFYSFKGGVGRSSATANVAYYLAEQGANVGCIDFDLEAAGLNYIFNIRPGFIAKGKKGKYLQHYLDPSVKNSDDDFGNYIVDVGNAKGYDLKGNLYLLPSATDAELTAGVPDSVTLMPIVNRLLKKYETFCELDYLLIDSRSGISNFALPSLVYTNILTIFFRWGRQHRDGTAAMVPWVRSFLRAFIPNLKLCLVASNIPQTIKNDDIKNYIENRLGDVSIDAVASVYENELLKTEEQILVNSAPESQTSKEYIFIADKLKEL
jgi:MinD-like ATPase involved in chromosome partitioning or flagellar assembly